MRNFWKKKVPAFLLALLMVATMIPMAGAAAADITETVKAGDSISFTSADFQNLYDSVSSRNSSDFSHLVFTEYSDLNSFGSLMAKNSNGSLRTLAERDLKLSWFYLSKYDEHFEADLDYLLNGLTFAADNTAEGTLTLEFDLCGEKSTDKYSCVMEITVGESSGSSSSDNYEITYKVAPGEEVELNSEHFYDFFRENITSSHTLRYVMFDRPSTTALTQGKLYYNYGSRSEQAFSRSNLADAYFLYDAEPVENNEYPLDNLSFVATDDFDTDVKLGFTAYYNSKNYVTGTLVLKVDSKSSSSSSSSSKVDADITYAVEVDDDIVFDHTDFQKFFNESQSGDLSHIRFTDITNLDGNGVLTSYAYDERNEDWDPVELDEEDALDGYFYYDDNDVEDAADTYCMDGMGFESAKNTDGEVVVLDFTAYGTISTKKAYGTLVIEIGDVKNSTSSKADLEYELKPGEELVFDEDDFNKVFQKEYEDYNFEYVYFTDSKNLGSYNGSMYYKYGRATQEQFSTSSLKKAYFYYDDKDVPTDESNCYALEDLSFVASEYFDTAITLEFTAYYSNSKQVSGTVTITPKATASDPTTPSIPAATNSAANILYTTTPGANVQLKANDFARFYEGKIAGSTFQSVKLLGVPSTGGLYYNYYSTSPYGTAARLQLTAYNCGYQTLYPSPVNTSQYALTELTFVPAANTTNYIASIPFAASGTGGYTVYGSVMISVTSKAIPEIYGVTPKNTAVSFPAPSISSAVSSGTSASLLGIQLLELPAASVGTVYVGTGTARRATTTDVYGVSGSTWTISQLRFVPATGYTGNVKIPYLAYDTNGKTVGVGTFSLGVVNKQVKFSDVNSSTWCYKYVAELSDAGVISGYTDGSFKPGNTISYGAALKMIMLAAGYSEQAPTVPGSTFSGYLAKAQADSLITRTNVNLRGTITRLQVAQLAAGAMKLNLNNLSTVKPFTDTSDKHVQALNDLGIMQGFTTTTFGPNSTLTRGQVSAIVWRMQNYQ